VDQTLTAYQSINSFISQTCTVSQCQNTNTFIIGQQSDWLSEKQTLIYLGRRYIANK